MDKRYQIFVSSTYADLKNERQKVIQALMEMDCIPAGMELFPAADEEQWEFIKNVIDDCDYYLLIIGGRYGSLTNDGFSYTEKEYDYAIEKGIKVIALIHGTPEELPLSKSEIDPSLREKLEEFKTKVMKNRLVRFWEKQEELPGLVALSLSKAIKMFPAIGWVKATEGDQSALLKQINELRVENKELKNKLEQLPSISVVEYKNLSRGNDLVVISGISFNDYNKTYNKKWRMQLSWNDILSLIGPDLYQHQNESFVSGIIAKYILENINETFYTYDPKLDDNSIKIIKIQFIALGYVNVSPLQTKGGFINQFWSLTEIGKQILMQIRSIKRTDKAQS